MAQIIVTDPFTQAVNFVFSEEGGYSVDPVPTNKGIEQKEYDTYRLNKGETKQTVKGITIVEATDIYKKNYWTPALAVSGDFDLVLIFAFDSMVNMGVTGATKIIQQAVSTTPDGLWGPHSEACLRDFIRAHTQLSAVVACGNIRRDHYRAIANNRAEDKQYLSDWLGRVNRLESLLVLLSSVR